MSQTENTLARKIEIERQFAVCTFMDANGTLNRCGYLKPEDFNDLRIREFWKSISEDERSDKSSAVMEAAVKHDMLGDLMKWENDYSVVSSGYSEIFAKEIVNLRWFMAQDKQITQLLLARKTHNPLTYREALTALVQEESPETRDTVPDVGQLCSEFETFVDNPSTRLIKTYIPTIDKVVGGLDIGCMSILAARPSIGKSTIAWQIARNVATNGKRVIYFANDMTRHQLWSKAVCGASQVQYEKVKTSALTPAEKERLLKANIDLVERYDRNLMIDDRTNHTTDSIWQVCLKYKPALVIIDILQRLKDKPASDTREVKRLGDIAYRGRELAKNLPCHVFFVTHVGRQVDKTESKRPDLADLRDSGELEQAADNVFFLHSDGYYNEKQPKRYLDTTWIVAKLRDGLRNQDAGLNFDRLEQWFYSDAEISSRNRSELL